MSSLNRNPTMLTKQEVTETIDIFSSYCADFITSEVARENVLAALNVLEKRLNENNKQYLAVIEDLCNNIISIVNVHGADASETKRLLTLLKKNSGYYETRP